MTRVDVFKVYVSAFYAHNDHSRLGSRVHLRYFVIDIASPYLKMTKKCMKIRYRSFLIECFI